jgi:hypothetical protein
LCHLEILVETIANAFVFTIANRSCCEIANARHIALFSDYIVLFEKVAN